MTEVIRKLARRSSAADDFDFEFHCPGCRCEHAFRVVGLSPRYKFNGDMNKPTIEPKLIYEWGTGRCHATVQDGMITFDSESSHRLAGMSVPLEAKR